MYLPNNFSTIPYEFQHVFISKLPLWSPKNLKYQIPSTENLIQQISHIWKIIWTNLVWFLSYSADRICFYYKETPTTIKIAMLIILMAFLMGIILYFVFIPTFLAILYLIGFTTKGVVAGSLAAIYQATQGGFIVADSIFSMLQSMAALPIKSITLLLRLLVQLPLRAFI